MAVIHLKNPFRDPMEDKIHEYIKNNLRVCIKTSDSHLMIKTFLDDELIQISSCIMPSINQKLPIF